MGRLNRVSAPGLRLLNQMSWTKGNIWILCIIPTIKTKRPRKFALLWGLGNNFANPRCPFSLYKSQSKGGLSGLDLSRRLLQWISAGSLISVDSVCFQDCSVPVTSKLFVHSNLCICHVCGTPSQRQMRLDETNSQLYCVIQPFSLY